MTNVFLKSEIKWEKGIIDCISVCTYQYSSFSHRMLNLIPPYYFCLLEHFERIQLTIVLLLDEDNFAIRALANNRYHLEVFFGNVGSGSLLLVSDTLLVFGIYQLFLFGLFFRWESRDKIRIRTKTWWKLFPFYLLFLLNWHLILDALHRLVSIHILIRCCFHCFYFYLLIYTKGNFL